MILYAVCSPRLAAVVGFSLFLTVAARAEELSASAQRMLRDVTLLASEEFEGRGIGTEGLQKAAAYVAGEFEKAGLDVSAVDGGPFQHFEVHDGARLGEPNRLQLVGPDGATRTLTLGEDFQVCSFGGTGSFDAPIVFAGYGISAPDAEYDDFAGLDVEGKAVLVLRRNPLQNDPHGPFAVGHGISRHAALTTKLSQAYQRGAVAVLFVNDVSSAAGERARLDERISRAIEQVDAAEQSLAEGGKDDAEKLQQELADAARHLQELRRLREEHQADELMAFGYGGTRAGKSLPTFHIRQPVADRLLGALDATLAGREAEIDAQGKPLSQEIPGWRLQGEASLITIRQPVKNVIGVLAGSGPLREETIVVGAHYDHLGRGGEGSLAPMSNEIHPGADDNASGTAGLLELARRLAEKGPLPRRIVFIAFTAEERGLHGSEEYVKSPVFPLDSTIAMFNMDMIGRMENDKLTLFGTGTSSRWEALDVEAADRGFALSKKPEGFGPSDHSSFYGKEIPVLHFFTGTHSDYHRPSDQADKINARDMGRIVDLLESLVVRTAEQPERPDYVQVAGRATLERSGNRPYFGSIPDFSSDVEGYALQGVAPGSPAERGGLKAGDAIIRFGGQKIGSLDDFDLALRRFGAGDQVELVVLRDGKEVTLKVTLGAPRG